MSAARTLGRAAAALVAAAALALGPAHAAVAADELKTAWDGDTVHLAWDGETYSTATESFIGLPVAVPGDRAFRRLVVTNDGSSAAVLRAWVVDVGIEGPDGAASRFFDDVAIDWSSASSSSSASLRTLAATDRTLVARVELEVGESTELTVGYEFPASSTAGNGALDGDLSASFDVLLRLEGDTDDDDGPPDDDNPPDDGDDDGSPDDELPETGAQLARSALVATLLVLGGMLLVFLARRRDRSHE